MFGSIPLLTSFPRRYHAQEACTELAVLIRCCFALSSKSVQSELYDLAQRALCCLDKYVTSVHPRISRHMGPARNPALLFC